MADGDVSNEGFFYLPYLRPILVLPWESCLDLLQ